VLSKWTQGLCPSQLSDWAFGDSTVAPTDSQQEQQRQLQQLRQQQQQLFRERNQETDQVQASTCPAAALFGLEVKQSILPSNCRKLGRLVQYVEDCVWPGDAPKAVLEAIENFAAGPGCWLKVAGGSKAEVLETAVQMQRRKDPCVIFECGAYIGYSTIRLSLAAQMPRSPPCHPVVVSVEVDPVQACIARHFIDIAGISPDAEVWVSQVRDIIPRLAEERSELSVALVFLDHRGQAFHSDLQQLERLFILTPGARAVADNVVSPGAPLLLWHLVRSGYWATRTWALDEFMEPGQEDWMAVATLCDCPSGQPELTAENAILPERLRELSWAADHFRRRSEGLRPSEPRVQPVDRRAFAKQMSCGFRALGIMAKPWHSSPAVIWPS